MRSEGCACFDRPGPIRPIMMLTAQATAWWRLLKPILGTGTMVLTLCTTGCGGKNFKMMFPGPRPDWSPRRVIPHVDVAIITRETGMLMILRPDNAYLTRLIKLLRNSSNYHKGKPSRKPDINIVVIKADGTRMSWRDEQPRYEYVSSTGELGSGDDWCVVPDEFRREVVSQMNAQTLRKVRPARQPSPRGASR